MHPRMNYFKAAPAVMKAMMTFEESTNELSIAPALRYLVKMRVSQINGCAYCLQHARTGSSEGGGSPIG